jgi:hypothetical protein
MPASIQARFRQKLTDPRYKESLRYALYDTLPFVSAVTSRLKFFATPSGQGGKTKEDTNLELAGMLPEGQKFSADCIELRIRPGSAVGAAYTRANPVQFVAGAPVVVNFFNDLWALGTRGVLRFNIGSGKTYLEDGPLDVFPALSGYVHFPEESFTLAAAASNQYTADYGRVVGRPYQLTPEIPIEGKNNFNVELAWDAGAFALPSTFTAQIQLRLLGVLFRN